MKDSSVQNGGCGILGDGKSVVGKMVCKFGNGA